MASRYEFELFGTGRFLPLFITQFLGAFNDNVYKNALILLIAFQNPEPSVNPDTLINLIAALFILPYFLFSAFAGQLADKYEKSHLIVRIKFIEVVLAIFAILGFYFSHLYFLLIALFLLGTQATFFGPLKYSILPQHLDSQELMSGNGFIEMGTFIAILLGTILSGILMGIPHTGVLWVAAVMITIALLGFTSSFFIPKAPAGLPSLMLNWHLLRQTFRIVKETRKNPAIFVAIIGISWFWLYGAIFLTQIAHYTKIILMQNEHIATLFLTAFSLGIGLGSVLCAWLSNKKVEIGFVILGSVGLTLFALDFAFVRPSPNSSPQDIITFLSTFKHCRLLCDAILIGAFGGIYAVPLYTLIQKLSPDETRSRIIAANNILNVLFMVAAAIIAIIVLNIGFSIPQLFMLIAILNAAMGFYLRKLQLMKIS